MIKTHALGIPIEISELDTVRGKQKAQSRVRSWLIKNLSAKGLQPIRGSADYCVRPLHSFIDGPVRYGIFCKVRVRHP